MSTIFTPITRPTTTHTPVARNSTVYTAPDEEFLLWASSTLPWMLTTPWQVLVTDYTQVTRP